MTIEHAAWTKVAARVVESINNRTLLPGSRLTQWELSDQKMVPREVVLEALEFLENAEVIRRVPELGWVVRADVRLPVQGPP